jgi:hypothetical protein
VQAHPVILDDVSVPEALKSTVWQKIADSQSYEEELDRIVRAIHDDRNRQESGSAPAYADVTALPGLYSTDTLVLRAAGDMALEGDSLLIRSKELLPRLKAQGVTPDAFLESLHVLEDHWYVEVHRTMGSGIDAASSFNITVAGLDLYAQEFIAGYRAMLTKVVAELVNGDMAGDRQIAEATGVQRMLVEHIFDVLESRGLPKVSKMTGPSSHIFNISPQLKRMTDAE